MSVSVSINDPAHLVRLREREACKNFLIISDVKLISVATFSSSHKFYLSTYPNGYHRFNYRKQRKKNKKTVLQQFKGAIEKQLLKLIKVCFVKALYQVVFGAKDQGKRMSMEWLPDWNIVLLTILCIFHHLSCIVYCLTSHHIRSLTQELKQTKPSKKKDK